MVVVVFVAAVVFAVVVVVVVIVVGIVVVAVLLCGADAAARKNQFTQKRESNRIEQTPARYFSALTGLGGGIYCFLAITFSAAADLTASLAPKERASRL